MGLASVGAIYAMFFGVVGLRFIPVSEGARIGALITSVLIFCLILVVEFCEGTIGDDVASVCAHMLRENGTVKADSKQADRYDDIRGQVESQSRSNDVTWRQFLRFVLSLSK